MAAAAATDESADAAQHSAHKSTIVASGHACSSGEIKQSGKINQSHNCCKKKTGETKPKAKGTSGGDGAIIQSGVSSSGTMKDCPLAVGRVVIVAKTRSGELSASPALAQSILPVEKFPEQTAPLSATPRLPNRGHTYLRCCVFLI